MKSLISKEIWKEREIAYLALLYFICRACRTCCKHKHQENRVHIVMVPVRIIRVIKTHRNELERTQRVIKKAHRRGAAVGNFACFSQRCFPFLGELYLWPVPPLYHFFSPSSRKSIARIIKLAADVMARYRRARSESPRGRRRNSFKECELREEEHLNSVN